MIDLREFIGNLHRHAPFAGELRYNEPLAPHTTLNLGGPADVWIRPDGSVFPEYAARLLSGAASAGAPVFILGGGANLVVSDKGIRGITLDTGGWSGCAFAPENNGQLGAAVIRSGTLLNEAAEQAASQGWGGLEFLAGLPGTLGGGVWMNARCYGKSLSDILVETEAIYPNGERIRAPARAEDYGYKKSPFQTGDGLILSGVCRITRRDTAAIRYEMETYRQDRMAKGQYRFPSAGSAFKNSPRFGEPIGAVIHRLGLRGLRVGGAQVAPWHGNLIINTGNATAADIRALVEQVTALVEQGSGLTPEPEILFVGDY